MKIKYFATREQARIAARQDGATFKDMGVQSERGKRWAIVKRSTARSLQYWLAALKSPDSVSRRVVEIKLDRKGNRVTVYRTKKIAVLE
ncbi:hypothetical protein Ecwhy1_504 [Escherichia phage Ecwhy_1]|uniref:hypothetical protein n=1 Tax=Escherichia coli TaxID=562 RepID=UPI0010172C35|nr:hypothetical protein Ecwhy1_504 [Escherichia phage Ecwhy_1]WIL00522.1 hypothetical protein [Escherichia phage vB_EcoM_CRJP21]WIL01105.1 hypothetical protein [Escherichia phage vB_EcoM_CRJP21]